MLYVLRSHQCLRLQDVRRMRTGQTEQVYGGVALRPPAIAVCGNTPSPSHTWPSTFSGRVFAAHHIFLSLRSAVIIPGHFLLDLDVCRKDSLLTCALRLSAFKMSGASCWLIWCSAGPTPQTPEPHTPEQTPCSSPPRQLRASAWQGGPRPRRRPSRRLRSSW